MSRRYKRWLRSRANEVAAALDIPPVGQKARTAEVFQWLDWWQESYGMAQQMPPDEIARWKAGRWWPPATARMVREIPPLIARRSPTEGEKRAS